MLYGLFGHPYKKSSPNFQAGKFLLNYGYIQFPGNRCNGSCASSRSLVHKGKFRWFKKSSFETDFDNQTKLTIFNAVITLSFRKGDEVIHFAKKTKAFSSYRSPEAIETRRRKKFVYRCWYAAFSKFYALSYLCVLLWLIKCITQFQWCCLFTHVQLHLYLVLS